MAHSTPTWQTTYPYAVSDVASDVEQNSELIALVGIAAYVRLRLFCLVAEHVWNAPSIEDRLALMHRSVRIASQQEALMTIARRHGVEPDRLMAPFRGSLDGIKDRTSTSHWFEGLITGLVGHTVSRDLVLLLSRGLPSTEASAVQAALAEFDDEDRAGARLVASAIAADDVLASRLGLWGRRVVGESLKLAQDLLTSNPLFSSLALRAAVKSHIVADAADVMFDSQARRDAAAWVLGTLTADHTHRMDALGLPA